MFTNSRGLLWIPNWIKSRQIQCSGYSFGLAHQTQCTPSQSPPLTDPSNRTKKTSSIPYYTIVSTQSSGMSISDDMSFAGNRNTKVSVFTSNFNHAKRFHSASAPATASRGRLWKLIEMEENFNNNHNKSNTNSRSPHGFSDIFWRELGFCHPTGFARRFSASEVSPILSSNLGFVISLRLSKNKFSCEYVQLVFCLMRLIYFSTCRSL